jgi:hypothetical protein
MGVADRINLMPIQIQHFQKRLYLQQSNATIGLAIIVDFRKFN